MGFGGINLFDKNNMFRISNFRMTEQMLLSDYANT